MHEDARGTIVPERIVEFWLLCELISSNEHRTKEGLKFVFLSLDRIHIDFIFSIIRPELDHILLLCYNILEFILIEDSRKG